MRHLRAILLLAAFSISVFGADGSGEVETPAGKRYVYKQANGVPLEMEIYFPEGWNPTKQTYPGIILFHGGGWGGGSLVAFRYQARYFASRGLIAATANYTLMKGQDYKGEGSRKRVCIVDAKSAIRWLKTHADELGLDSKRLIAGGGSAGGHVSMLATHNPGLNDPDDPTGIDTAVAAYVLFNPAFSRGDAADAEVDMLQHLDAEMPPAIVFFGTEDKWKSGWDAVQQQLESRGNPSIDLQLAPGAAHAFFNRQPWKDQTLIAADKFLAALGLLEGPPNLPVPPNRVPLVRRN